MSNELVLSQLGHTWILDLDGTIVKHNGYLIGGKDTLLDGVLDFFKKIPKDDCIIFLTSRKDSERENTIAFLENNSIRYNHIIFNIPYGERIVINDNKPSGLQTCYAVNKERDTALSINIVISKDL